jgi:hypothetical protein
MIEHARAGAMVVRGKGGFACHSVSVYGVKIFEVGPDCRWLPTTSRRFGKNPTNSGRTDWHDDCGRSQMVKLSPDEEVRARKLKEAMWSISGRRYEDGARGSRH